MHPLLINNAVLQGFIFNCFLLMMRLFTVAGVSVFTHITDGIVQKKKKNNVSSSKESSQTESTNTEETKSIWMKRCEVSLKIHRNDTENILPFMVICVPYVLVSSLSYSSIENPQFPLWNAIIGNILMASFTLSRFVYFFMYWNGWAPLRSLTWAWGVLSTVLIGFYTIICMYVL